MAAALRVTMNGENGIITVFIVAASAIVRAGLESVLQTNETFVVAGSAAEISAAPFDFAAGQTPNVFLINVGREKDFSELLALFGDHPEEIDSPAAVVLFPPEMQNPEFTGRALRGGVRGILPLDASANEIAASVAAAAAGLVSLSPEMMENLLSRPATTDAPNSPIENTGRIFSDETVESLTAREAEILEMLADGTSNKSIAYQLNISEHTVKFHVASIFAKLGVSTRTEAVTQALRGGLILL